MTGVIYRCPAVVETLREVPPLAGRPSEAGLALEHHAHVDARDVPRLSNYALAWRGKDVGAGKLSGKQS